MIHPRHAAHIHAHVFHGEQGTRAEWWNGREHPFARRKRGSTHSRPVDRLADEAVGAVPGGDDDVERFSDADLELIHGNGADILTIRLDDRHRQVRDADIEVRLGRRVDDAKPHAFAGTKQARPVVVRSVAIDRKIVGRSSDVGDVGGVHPHLGPFTPLLGRHVAAGKRTREGQALVVEVATAHLLQLLVDRGAAQRRVIGEDEHVLAVVSDRIRPDRIDYDRAIKAILLLVGRMRMVPVRPVVRDRELVGEGRARHDAWKADAWNPVHLERHEQPVPVDRALFIKRVLHPQAYTLTFLEADERSWHGAVHSDGAANLAVHLHGDLADRQSDIRAANGR